MADTKRLTVICGAYGSGKTEFAMAYALDIYQEGNRPTGLVDLDIVNPYFRSRDARVELTAAGLTVISTEPGLETADLPALSPRIYSLLQDKRVFTVFDVGGDPAGARALGRFNSYFQGEPYNFWVVVNPYRPDTKTPEQGAGLIAALEKASRLRANGLVSNINLGRETDFAIWSEGMSVMKGLSAETGIPIVRHMVEEGFYQSQTPGAFAGLPVFPVKLRMLPPWLRS